MTKNKKEYKYRIFNKSKTTYIEYTPKSEPFLKNNHIHILLNDVSS